MIDLGCSLYSFGFIKLPSFDMFLKSCIEKMCQQKIRYFELPIWETFSRHDSNKIMYFIEPCIECYSIHFPKHFSAQEVLQNDELLEGVLDLKPSVAVLHAQSILDFEDEYEKLRELLKNCNCILCTEFIIYDDKFKDYFTLYSGLVDIVLDFYHCANAGLSGEKIIESYSDSIKHIHFNDYKKLSKALSPGEGILPLNKYINILSRQNYKGVYMLECRFDNEQHFARTVSSLR